MEELVQKHPEVGRKLKYKGGAADSNVPVETPLPTKFDAYKIEHKLGEGSYGVAHLAVRKDTHAKCVLKISKGTEKDRRDDLNEIEVLSDLDHHHITKFLDTFLDEEEKNVIVLEYYPGGDLKETIKNQKSKGQAFPEEQVNRWFTQMCLGMEYLHGKNILHRDLKPSNILLTADLNIKISDFGLSKILEHTFAYASTNLGTIRYCSPEVLSSQRYNKTSDVWSLGCVLHELAALEYAFPNFADILTCTYKPLSNSYNKEIREILSKIFKKDRKTRPSVSELLEMIVEAAAVKAAAVAVAAVETAVTEAAEAEAAAAEKAAAAAVAAEEAAAADEAAAIAEAAAKAAVEAAVAAKEKAKDAAAAVLVTAEAAAAAKEKASVAAAAKTAIAVNVLAAKAIAPIFKDLYNCKDLCIEKTIDGKKFTAKLSVMDSSIHVHSYKEEAPLPEATVIQHDLAMTWLAPSPSSSDLYVFLDLGIRGQGTQGRVVIKLSQPDHSGGGGGGGAGMTTEAFTGQQGGPTLRGTTCWNDSYYDYDLCIDGWDNHLYIAVRSSNPGLSAAVSRGGGAVVAQGSRAQGVRAVQGDVLTYWDGNKLWAVVIHHAAATHTYNSNYFDMLGRVVTGLDVVQSCRRHRDQEEITVLDTGILIQQ